MAQMYIPNEYAQVLIRLALAGDSEEMAVTIGAHLGTGTDAQDVSDAIASALQASGCPFDIAGSLLVGYTFVGVTARLSDGTNMSVAETIVNLAGTGSGDPLPNNCAFLLRKLTASAGRHGRGRMYLPPYRDNEGNVDATGTVDPAIVSTLTDEWNQFRDAVLIAGVLDELDLFHYPYTGQPTPAPTAITGFACQNRIATRRLRLRP